MKLLIFFSLFFILSSCALNKELRRNAKAERKLNRALELNPKLSKSTVLSKDTTVYLYDTIYRKEIIRDTMFIFNQIDSTTIIDTVYKTEVFIRRKIDSFYVRIFNPADTVFITDSLSVTYDQVITTIEQSDMFRTIRSLLWILVIVFVIGAGLAIFFKIRS